MQNWEKLGQIFTVNNSNPYLITHSSNPLALLLKGNIFRIFYSGRNFENRSSVGYVDIDIVNRRIMNYPKHPAIIFGPENSFYSHGISIGNQFVSNGSSYILFMGWQNNKGEHYRGEIGRLKLENMKELCVVPDKPFISIDEVDKLSLSYPFVLYHNGYYKMWYGSTITWDAGNGEMLHVIKYATSPTGKIWLRHGVAIPYEIGVAQAFSKPSVIIDNIGYHMWYSYRDGCGTKYRIGYAFSNDGIIWKREEKNTCINVSVGDWDSEMICYPYVFDHKGKRYMLYNGNNFGKTGFGLAVLEQD